MTRSELRPGEFTLLWDRLGRLQGEIRLGERVLSPVQICRSQAPAQSCAVVVPEDTAPGTYPLTVAGVEFGRIIVIPPRPPRERRFTGPWVTEDRLEELLAQYDVVLMPGEYPFKRAIRLPDDCDLRGYGAHVFRDSDGDYGERMFLPGQRCKVEGLTFHPIYLVFHANPPAYHLTLRHCTFEGGNLGYSLTEALIADCAFHTAISGDASGLWIGCTFSGDGDSLIFDGVHPGNTAVIDCTFRGLQRGPVVFTHYAPFVDNLIQGTRCYDITGDGNGGEVWGCEGVYEFSRNLILDTRVYQSEAIVFHWDVEARDNVIAGYVSDGPSIVHFSGWGGKEITGNVLQNFEIRGGRVIFGSLNAGGNIASGGVHSNTLRDGAFGPVIGSRLNQPNYDPWFYQARPAVQDIDGGNAVENVTYGAVTNGVAV